MREGVSPGLHAALTRSCRLTRCLGRAPRPPRPSIKTAGFAARPSAPLQPELLGTALADTQLSAQVPVRKRLWHRHEGERHWPLRTFSTGRKWRTYLPCGSYFLPNVMGEYTRWNWRPHQGWCQLWQALKRSAYRLNRHVIKEAQDWSGKAWAVNSAWMIIADMHRHMAARVWARLVEEGRGRQPEPVGRVNGRVAVDEQPVERVAPALPRHIQVAARQEARLPCPVYKSSPHNTQVAGLGGHVGRALPHTWPVLAFSNSGHAPTPVIAAMHPNPVTKVMC
jgi:hypothetical protein